jgi:hypothetical protein
MKRLTPQKLLNVCLVVIFVGLVLPLYVVKGLNDSLDHARGTGTVGGIDFKAYYIAAGMIRAGKDFYDVEQQKQEVEARGLPLNESFYIYPPLLAVLFVPLTTLPIYTAARLWFFFNLALYGVSLTVLWRALKLGQLSKNLPLLWTLAFLFPPALFTLYKGQVNVVILLLLILTYWLCTRGSERASGFVLGVAAMIKVIPICLVPYLAWRKRYKLCVATIVTIVVIGILGLIIVGVGPHRTYLSVVLPSLAQPRPNPGNQSLGGFLSLLLIENAYSDHLIHSPLLWKTATLALSLFVIGGVVLVLWRSDGAPEWVDLEYALVVTTLPLIANIAWVDLFVLLLIPYAVLYKHALQRQMTKLWMLLSIVSVLCVSFTRVQDVFTSLVGRNESFLRNPFAMGIPFYGLILLWMATAATSWAVVKQERTHEPTPQAR